MTVTRARYAGLEGVKGVQSHADETIQQLVCPVCSNPDLALLAGKISFSAKVAGTGILDGAQSLSAFVCPESHIFFLKERDVLPTKTRTQ